MRRSENIQKFFVTEIVRVGSCAELSSGQIYCVRARVYGGFERFHGARRREQLRLFLHVSDPCAAVIPFRGPDTTKAARCRQLSLYVCRVFVF